MKRWTLCNIKLWSINRWLRYTGFRVFVELDEEDQTTSVGIMWWGFKDF